MGILGRGLSIALLAALVGVGLPGSAAADPAPGTVTSTSSLEPEFAIPGAASSTRVTYWTTGPTQSPALSTGVVSLPPGTPPPGGWPVVSWAHGTVGVGDQCAPSVRPLDARDSRYLAHWLAQGYAVVATDYAGLGSPGPHAYLEKTSAARSVVDMVRAGRAVEPTLSDRWLAVGQSQGGHAAVQAAHIATAYAPELDFRGAVATGTASNLEYAFQIGGPWIPGLGVDGLNVFAAYILAGLREARPDVDVDSYLTPIGKAEVDGVEDSCPGDLRAEHESVGAMLSRPIGGSAMFDALSQYLGVPTAGYDRPLFLGQGVIDTMVPSPLSVKLLADLRASGTDVTYVPYLFADGEFVGHGGSMIASLADTTPFVHRLLDPA
ncbi:lipase family protein [Antrihabitans sp. YC2-6]|uniref:lipase family protein n=1 Tax=Antrihabitans sp. YC2-6 TaxID=2799498 RepID=UPI0018F60481|nr:lipase family protein [Antrihabitans sp. YC2-6]MBJ8344020.1 lipase [Antrihabitans sp. YC2-6]